MRKMTQLYKISFSALFIAVGIILSRFFSIPYLFGLSFLKISFTMSVVFFCSFYLGPIYGTIVSFSIDFFGALLFPQGGPYDPLFSIPAIIEGFIPFFSYYLLRKINNDKAYPIILGILLLILDVFIVTFVSTHDSFSFTNTSKVYELTLITKILISLVFTLISIVFFIAITIFTKKGRDIKFNKYYNVFLIVSAMAITNFLFKIPISSAISMYRFEYSFEIIFATKTMTAFISMFVHAIIVSIALGLSLKVGPKGALIDAREIEIEEDEEIDD